MKRIIAPLFFAFGITLLGILFYQKKSDLPESHTPEEWRQIELAEKRAKRLSGYAKMDQPGEYVKYHLEIRTRDGEVGPEYAQNYKLQELQKAMQLNAGARTQSLDWVSRGPGNVPGRTRAITPIPTDPLNTWVVGSSGGGIWKTTNGGQTWQNKSEDFPSLAVTTIAVVESSPNILYAGTGEHIASAGTAIVGDGIFKSVDTGETWTQLASTAGNADFRSVTRVIVDPDNENLILASTAENVWDDQDLSQIMRSEDGGNTWTKVYTAGNSVDQIVADPDNFNIQYGTVNSRGVIKSEDAGLTWRDAKTGMSPNGRIEISVSPVTTNRLFASAQGNQSGNSSDLYVSDDFAETWTLITDPTGNDDFLGGQGWYDNTIMADPFDPNVVYYGGVNVWKSTVSENNSIEVEFDIDVFDTGVSDFWDVFDFGQQYYRGGMLIGDSPQEDFVSLEIRFGPGRSQMAHRFEVPDGRGSGAPRSEYSYQDYIEVPFEVWDTETNQQLMVSFRDQQKNRAFDLIDFNTSGNPLTHSREYLFIHSIPYDELAPNPQIATTGGHEEDDLYFIWPILPETGSWTPSSFPESIIDLNYNETFAERRVGDQEDVTDAYLQFSRENAFFGNPDIYAFHPDQHALVPVIVNEPTQTYRIINGSDGGVFYSNISSTPGVNDGDWTFSGFGYNTSQFYGADKKPGADEYIGGMQDQGTWKSPVGEVANESTLYIPSIGGDGFNVIWHSKDPSKVIGGSQNNGLRRTLDDGASWSGATTGLTGSAPFITKLANSADVPDVLFTVTSDGVFRSEDFGGSWNLTPITDGWVASTSNNVKVSLSDFNTVWAGSGMSASRKMHVSTDGGRSFTAVNNYPENLGAISGLETHPIDPNTAYTLFSFAGGPKVLRTEDLGETWEEISGFGSGNVSSNGFPDVAVYCLLVFPNEPETIWVGTEIGLFESTDNGETWHIADNGFPAAAIWQMKIVDNQVVVATHGRGIWSVEFPNLVANPAQIEVRSSGTTIDQKLFAELYIAEPFDSLEVELDAQVIGGIAGNDSPQFLNIEISGVQEFGKRILRVIGYRDGIKFAGPPELTNYFEVGEELEFLEADFTRDDLAFANFGIEWQYRTPSISNSALHSPHPYLNNQEIHTVIKNPIIISEDFPVIQFKNLAIIEPGDEGFDFGTEEFRDYVVVEGSKDGKEWIEFEEGYDARESTIWSDAYESGQLGNLTMFEDRIISMTPAFDAGDTILIRFRLFADGQNNAFGWVIDDIIIQEDPLGLDDLGSTLETDLVLFPNPVQNGRIQAEYFLENATEVSLIISDLSGKVIQTDDLGLKNAGRHSILRDILLPDGVYLFTLSTPESTLTERLIVK